MLKHKKFDTFEEMEKWANGPDGTEFIISIVIDRYQDVFIFYIDESNPT